jgi:Sulfotransferase domain
VWRLPWRTKDKVFCIGWHKTGTTSVQDALYFLGYRVGGWDRDRATSLIWCWREGRIEKIIKAAREFDALKDWPWPLVFREMAQAFPTAKFILTTRRDNATWLRSFRGHIERTPPWIGTFLIYGTNETSDGDFLMRRYAEHNEQVREFFKNSPNRLLEISLENGAGWREICSFLNAPIPKRPFPHKLKSQFGPT